MKILHLISGGDTGGAKTHVLSLVKELNKYVEAKIVCFLEDTFYTEGKALGINIQVIKQKKRYDLSVVKKLINIIENEGYDIIHCHGARANFIAMLLKLYIKKPMVTTIHSDYKLDFKDNVYKRLIYTFLNKTALKCFNYYIAVSSSFKNMLCERGFKANKIFIVYNGIDFENTFDIIPKNKFLEKYRVDYKNEKIVGIAARLDTNKDIITLLNAAKIVLDERKDVIFLIAGEGDECKRLKDHSTKLGIDHNTKFLGFVNQPYSFFNVLDINVLTSKSESFPYVILEGAKLKKPIVSTNVGGLEDLVDNGINGYLFEVGNSQMLADYLKEMLNNDEKTSEMGNNLYEIVKNQFSLNKMALDHCKIYEDIIKP
ncbi:glycosyltransferase [Abyssisolibacter fermentans]|uniref:glycosyltransferase n=1 Tax=Abyssisolibacter fermentans TaxID=1766203 RepID=UPI00082CC9C0|nr:glycosyltransferase [Abyssisolibacter fermentans]